MDNTHLEFDIRFLKKDDVPANIRYRGIIRNGTIYPLLEQPLLLRVASIWEEYYSPSECLFCCSNTLIAAEAKGHYYLVCTGVSCLASLLGR